MPLIDLKTDLKSLRYGKDTPGGGYSGQPYIQAKIPDGFTSKSPDFLLRNGYLAPLNALEDIKRLGKMFGDLKSPNGILFTAKQNVLSNSAVRTQASGVLNEGVYTPLSTLAQAGVVFLGGHLNKQGINPFAQTGAYATNEYLYQNVIKADNLAALNSPDGILRNRLFALYESKIQNNVIGGFANNSNIAELPSNILSYQGGPGSILGVGNTNIRFADQRTGINNPLAISNPNYFYGKNTKQVSTDYFKIIGTNGVSGKYARLTRTGVDNFINNDGQRVGVYNFNVYEPAIEGNTWPENSPLIYSNYTYTYNQQDIINQSVNEGKQSSRPSLQDFRKILRQSLLTQAITSDQNNAKRNGATPDTPNYNSGKAYENRVNIGSKNSLGPGNSTNKNLVSYTAGSGIGPVDKLNALTIYRSENVAQNSNEYPVNDLVKFRIAAIDGSNPNFKTFMHFRAFINSFNDSYTADWGRVRYLGRGENFYNYNGFDRQISLSFTVSAQSKEELIPMYKKLNYLASNLTPDYSPYGYMRGPLVELTMGGYLYNQVGFIQSLTYDIPEDTPWEIGINDEGNNDPTVKELPHRINVSSFQFIPIHDFVPGKQGLDFGKDNRGFVEKYGPQRYIALEAVNNNYDS